MANIDWKKIAFGLESLYLCIVEWEEGKSINPNKEKTREEKPHILCISFAYICGLILNYIWDRFQAAQLSRKELNENLSCYPLYIVERQGSAGWVEQRNLTA